MRVADRPSVAVWFLSSPASVGSLAAARLAASLGLPVFVFCAGFAPSALAPLCLGARCALVHTWPVASGPLAGAVRWVAG